MPLKTITIKKVYTKSALETMPEVLEALSTALCSATLWRVVGGTGQAGRANLLMSGPLGPAIAGTRGPPRS